MVLPSDWEAADAALTAARPANAIEARVQTGLAHELAAAVRAFEAGTHLHERVSPNGPPSYIFLQTPLTTPELAAQALAAFWPTFRTHLRDAVAHVVEPPTVTLPGAMPSDPLVAANQFKAAFNAHIAVAGLHFGDASGAELLSADATGDASLVALVEEIRLQAEPHRRDGGQITVVTTINARAQQTQYAERLSVHNRRVAQSQATFADAEPVARSAAIALGLSPWSELSYSQASANALIERFTTLRAQPAYASHEYCIAVAEPAARAINRDAYFGSAPTPPAADAPTTTTRISGTVDPTREAELEATIDRCNQFSDGLNAV